MQLFLLQLLCFAENTIKIVLSEEHSFSKTQLVEKLFHPRQKTPFSKQRCHFWFWAISAEITNFIVFPGFDCFGPKILARTDSVHENACGFSPFLTQIVSGNFLLKLQSEKLESAQNFSRLILRHFSPDALQLRMANFKAFFTLQTFVLDNYNP